MKTRRSRLLSLIILALILVASTVCVFVFINLSMSAVNTVFEQESLAILTETSRQTKTTIDNYLDSNWLRIEGTANALAYMQQESADRVLEFLQQSHSDAHQILLVSDSGYSIDQTGKKSTFRIEREMRPMFQTGERFSQLYQEGKTDTLLFTVRCPEITVNGVTCGYLFVYYDLQTFMDLLNTSSFSGQGYVRLIDSSGQTILHSSNLADSETCYLYFASFENAQFLNNQTITDAASFKEAVMAGNNDSVHIIDANGVEMMVSFARIDSMDWYLCLSVDYDVVMGNRRSSIENIGIRSAAGNVLIIVIALVMMISVTSREEKKISQSNEKLTQANRELTAVNDKLQAVNQELSEANRSLDETKKQRRKHGTRLSMPTRPRPSSSIICPTTSAPR